MLTNLSVTFILFLLSVAVIGCASFSKSDACDAQQIHYGPRDEFRVEVTEYRSKNSASKSLIIMPPTGGTTFVDRSYAKKFCSAGYDVFLVNHWTGDSEERPDLDIHQVLYQRGQRAIEIVIAEIKTPFIGLLGTSVGALHAEVAAARLDSLDAVFLIVGGAPIREIIVHSDQKAMRKVREERKTRFGLNTDEEQIAALQKAFRLEPLELSRTPKAKRIGMVIATEDTTVPTENQKRLSEAWRPRTLITLASSHFWAISKSYLFHMDEILAFFEDSAKSTTEASLGIQ